jgi:hypothetical protein
MKETERYIEEHVSQNNIHSSFVDEVKVFILCAETASVRT